MSKSAEMNPQRKAEALQLLHQGVGAAEVARRPLRSWLAAVLGREPAEPGTAFEVDRFEAEAIAGGPPSDEDLAPYRAAAEAIALEVFVSVVAREFASIRQALEA